MTAREVIAVTVVVWLAGAVVGWCVGWVARGEQNRGWYAGVARELARTRAELAEARAELDVAYAQPEWPLPPGSVVHVHLSAPPPPAVGPSSWTAGQVVQAGEVVVPVLPRRGPPAVVTPRPGRARTAKHVPAGPGLPESPECRQSRRW